jgi:D-alanyl-D-alanine carboxypeptidase
MLNKTLINPVLVLAILLSLGVSAAHGAPPAQEGTTYTVKRGDYLWALAKKYLGDGHAYRDIVAATNAKHDEDPSFAHIVNPDLIHPGWKLLIPDGKGAVTSKEDITAQLQTTLDNWRKENDIIGVTLAVDAPELGSVALASGLSDRDAGTPMTPDHRLGVGSVTKTWIATLTLQLVDEGALTLDDTLSRWFPDFPNADKITVRQLLSHTSGATNYYVQLEQLAGIFLEKIDTDWRGFTPDELLDVATELEPSFEPGEDLGYSNTNYVLLGRIVELVTGNPLHAELRSRIYEPLGLENTFLGGDEDIPGGWGPGYTTEYAMLFSETDPTAALYERVAAKLATLPWASGALVTTAPDLLRFERALFGGELLERATLTEMFTPVVVSENHVGSGLDLSGGLGVFEVTFPTPLGSGVGHDGGIPGFSAAMLFFPDHDVSVVLLVNDDRAETGIIPPPDRVIETLVYDALVQVLEHTTGEEIELEVAQTAPGGNVYEDPRDRFTIPLVGNWAQVETDGTYALFEVPGLDLSMYVVTVESDDLEAGADVALRQIGIDPSALTKRDDGSLGDWHITFYWHGEGKGVTPLCQVDNEVTYCLIATGDDDLTKNPPEHVMRTLQGFAIAGKEVDLPTTVEEFEAYINSFVGDVPPGLSIVIALGGDILYAKGFGMADGPKGMAARPDTVYLWASMTKMATATAIMQLVDQGLVDLDGPVSDYLDYVPAKYGITVRQLLTHSGGLGEPADFVVGNLRLEGQAQVDPDVYVREFLEQFTGLTFEPGSASSYSSPGTVMLGQVVAEVSGQPYIEYVQEHILAPLGMVNTDCIYSSQAMIAKAAAPALPAAQVEDLIAMVDQIRGLGDGVNFIREADDRHGWMNRYTVFGAGGCLIGPPTEAIRFAQMHLNDGELDGVRILSREAVALMQEMQYSTKGDPFGWGLGWEVAEEGEHPYVEHDGGGTGVWAKMRLYPKDGLAIVLMSNADGWDRDRVADAAANVVFSLAGRG